MNKVQALHSFFSSFDLPAYEENSVPDDISFPYITYALNTGYALERISLAFSLWYRSKSQEGINLKTAEIAQTIGLKKVLPCDEGGIIIYPGTPFAQGMSDPSDPLIKRKLINLEVEYVTTY